MVEVVIERWTGRDGATDHRWSVWLDGRRVRIGGPHPTVEASADEALTFCRLVLEREPDRVTRL